MYFVSTLRAGGAANACRTLQGRASAALAPAPHLRKDRLVIVMIIFLPFRCVEAREHNGNLAVESVARTDFSATHFYGKCGVDF
jgi:hypothetical protein